MSAVSSVDPATRALVEDALTRIRTLKAALHDRDHAPIAIVGLAGRFPDAPDVDVLWSRLVDGETAIREDLARRLGRLDGAVPRHAALLDAVDGFDHAFFEMTPLEARAMDPQHRLLLEVAWEALEDAAMGPSGLGRRTGVFIGLTAHDYLERAVTEPDVYTATGNGMCFSAGRLSHFLGVSGPSLTIDTACSSSLVAVHLACASLRRGEAEVALAGGCGLLLSAATMDLMARTEALSPTGRAATFDADANGYVRGEGCAVVVLKPLADARRDGDRVWAVIRGSAVNHDGASSTLTAPNPAAQEELLRAAWADAGVACERLGYFEAHGTGTPLGDPIEVDAIREVFAGARGADGRAYLGSIKTNVGHLEAAAGIAGLTRAVLALHHRVIPVQAGFRALNPHIALENTSLSVPRASRPWVSDGPRVAGVSAFGMSGTNAHVVLEEAPPHEGEPREGAHAGMLVLGAQSDAALRQRARDLLAVSDRWDALCRASARHVEPMPHRAVIVGPEGRAALEALAHGGSAPGLFEGVVASGAARCALVIGDAGDGPPPRAPSVAFEDAWSDAERALRQAGGGSLAGAATGPRTIALAVASLAHLRALGVEPVAFTGRGEGSVAAAHLRGEIDLDVAMQRALRGARPSGDEREHVPDVDLWLALTGDGVVSPADDVPAVTVTPSDASLRRALASLHLAGVPVAWPRVVGTEGPARLRLPAYPWQRTRHFIDLPGDDRPDCLALRWVVSVAGPQALRPARVALLADHDEPRSRALADALRRAGARAVHLVSSAREAIECADADLIVCAPWVRARDRSEEVRQVLTHARGPVALLTQGAAGPPSASSPSTPFTDVVKVEMVKGEAALLGLGRATFLETPGRLAALVDLDDASIEQAAAGLLRGDPELERAYRDGVRHVPRLAPLALPSAGGWAAQGRDAAAARGRVSRSVGRDGRAFAAPRSSEDEYRDGVHLVTGGLGGVGRAVVDHLASRGARHVVVCGRRSPDAEARAWLGARGVVWVGGDVSVETDVARILDAARARGPLRSVFHVAGVGSSAPLVTMTQAECDRVAAPKVAGARWLDALTEDDPLERFVAFSSLAGVLTGSGQGAYAAANLELDAVIRKRRARGRCGTSIRWGLFDGPGLPSADERARLVELGLRPMDPAAALEVMDDVVASGLTEVVVASADWASGAAVLEVTGRSVLEDLRARPASSSSEGPATPVRDPSVLEERVLAGAARALGVSRAELDPRRSLHQLGLDSLGAIKLRRELVSAGVPASVSMILKASSVEALVRELVAAPSIEEPVDAPPPSATSPVERVEVSLAASAARSPTPWLVVHAPRPEAPSRLFCFAYAGGGPSVFAGWGARLPSTVELLAVQLPARGARLAEAPIVALDELVDRLLEGIRPHLDRPFAFFGHCMGALVQHELTRRLVASDLPAPHTLFVSGARSPDWYTEEQLDLDVLQFSPRPPLQVHEMDDDEVVAALTELRFTGAVEALQDPEVQRLLLPAVRADFQLANAHRYVASSPLDVPVVAMGGRADPYVSAAQLLGWRAHTTASFEATFCSGDHYFLAPERARWLERIARRFEAIGDPASSRQE